MEHSAANVVVLEPLPARHIAESPGVGGTVLPMKRRRKGAMRYAGLSSRTGTARLKRKYSEVMHVNYAGVRVRLLTDPELAEWHKRIGEIIDGKKDGQLRREPLPEKGRL